MTAEVISIREGTPADLDAILELERAVDTAPHWPIATYQQILSSDSPPAVQRRLFVATSAGGILGFAVAALSPVASNSPAEPECHTAELDSIAVAPNTRRAGIGRRLCQSVLAWCRANHATGVELEVRASGSPAIALYRSLGFAEIARRPRYYDNPPDDALLMRLDLTDSQPDSQTEAIAAKLGTR